MRHLMVVLAGSALILNCGAARADLGDQFFKHLADDGAAGDSFGISVAISGATAIVGAVTDDDNGDASGSAYLFDIATGLQIAKLIPSDGAVFDYFGWSVSISGTSAIIGAVFDDDNGAESGSAYIFREIDGVWTEISKLGAVDSEAGSEFGTSVAISGNTAIVGARGDDDDGPGSGSAYIFREVDGEWMQVAKLTADDGAESDNFGINVGVSGDTAIVGALGDDDLGDRSGSAYIFREVDGEWMQIAKLTAGDGADSDDFGIGVDISGDTAIVGAHGDDDNGSRSGSAYIFRELDGVWTEISKLTAQDGATNDRFGVSVALSGPTAIVGAYQDNDNGTDSGSVYIFDTTTGLQFAKLLANDGAAGDRFGFSVAISGKIAVVGAEGNDDFGAGSGSAYSFDAGTDVSLATLTSCAITFGSTDNPPCEVANLADNDAIDQILRSQFGFSVFERNLAEIVIEGTAADATIMASIVTRDGSDTTNVVAKVKARNYTSNVIVDLGQYDVSIPSDDTLHSTPVNSADYVDTDGDIEVRLRYVAPATFTPLGFTVGLDLVWVMEE